jgi:very-short-patch-repair endonuclease
MKRFFPYNPKLKKRAVEMRKNITKSEQIIWFNYLKKINIRVLRQRPIWNFIVDFYIPSKKIIIEIDWDSHNTENALVYDLERTKILEWFWLNILRFTNNDINNNFLKICNILNKELNIQKSPL